MIISRLLLSASATYMLAAGAGATFLAGELLGHVRQPEAPILLVFVQTIGALYLAFAVLNWMSRGVTAGGIYARPLVVANVLHFTMVGILLLKWAVAGAPPAIGVLAAVYVAFAAGFGVLIFRQPPAR